MTLDDFNPEQHQLPPLPAPRNFRLTFENGNVEYVSAHEVGYSGTVLTFTTYRIDPVLGPSGVLTLAINGWANGRLEEIITPTSSLLVQ